MKLNNNGRELVRHRMGKMDRQDIVDLLEGRLCVACYDEETVEDDFAPSFSDSVDAGDVEIDDLPAVGDHWEQMLLLYGIDADDEDAEDYVDADGIKV
jgi:hypothetical protein